MISSLFPRSRRGFPADFRRGHSKQEFAWFTRVTGTGARPAGLGEHAPPEVADIAAAVAKEFTP
jgi:hypothetical protein